MNNKTLTDKDVSELEVGTQVKLIGEDWPTKLKGTVVRVEASRVAPNGPGRYFSYRDLAYSLYPSHWSEVDDYSVRLANNRDIGFEGTHFEVGDVVKLTGIDWWSGAYDEEVTVETYPIDGETTWVGLPDETLTRLEANFEAILVTPAGYGVPPQKPKDSATGGYTTAGPLTGKVHDSVTWTIAPKTEDPKDYYQGTDVLDFIERHELGFPLGNAVKYISRAGKKPGQELVKDLTKAIDYIQFVIDKENDNDR